MLWKLPLDLDRMFLAILSQSYAEEKLEDGFERVVLRIPSFLAPVKCAIFPLAEERRTSGKSTRDYGSITLRPSLSV